MKIKNVILFEVDFNDALEALSLKDMPVSQCLEFIEAIEEAGKRATAVQETKKTLILKRCKKDKDGNAVQDAHGEVSFPSKEEKDQCKEELNKLMEEYFAFPMKEKIKIMSTDKFKPRHLALVKELVDVVDPE